MKKLTKKITALLAAAIMSACLPAAFADVPTGYVKSSYNILYQKLPEYPEGSPVGGSINQWTDGVSDNKNNGANVKTTWAIFDLGTQLYLSDVQCIYRNRTGDYTISVSSDKDTWTPVGSYSGTADDNERVEGNVIEVNQQCRYIKIERANEGIIGMCEVIAHDLFRVPEGYIKSTKNALSGITPTYTAGSLGGGQGLDKLTDGDVTEKSFQGFNGFSNLQFDMSEVKPIAEIDIYQRNWNGGTFTLSVSEDNVNWITIGSYKVTKTDNAYENQGPFEINRNCRYIKLERDAATGVVFSDFQAFAYVPGYEIKSVTASPAENENIEVTLSRDFTGTDTDGLFTVTDKTTKETVASKVENISGGKITVSFDEYLTAGKTYEIAFSEAAVEKYGEEGTFLADGKKEFTVKKKAVSQTYDKNDGELTVSTESTTDVTVYAFLMHFDANGKLISAGFEIKTGTASSTNAATISVSKAADADKSYAVIFTYDADTQSYTPMGKIEID